MASEADMAEISSLFERMVRDRDISQFVPFLMGLSNPNSRADQQEEPDQENGSRTTRRNDRIILINPFTQTMTVIEGSTNFESLFSEIGRKDVQPPASKASIEALQEVEIGEGAECECVICLDEVGVGAIVKEMPCKHRFHGNCVEKWLRIHGTCPVCRFRLPVDDEEGKKVEDGDNNVERRVQRDIWVSFSFSNGGPGQDSSRDSENYVDSSSIPSSGTEI